MDYGDFRCAFLTALKESGLPVLGFVPAKEVLDLRSTGRSLTVYVEPVGRTIGGPFYVSGELSFEWDALQTARTSTTEDDLLAELLGREETRAIKTERPWLRVDIKLRAGLEHGKSIPMPPPAAWATWSREAIGRLQTVEPLVTDDVTRKTSRGHHAVLAWQGDPEAKVLCTPGGELRLDSITVSAFQGIDLARQWSDSERKPDSHPGKQLVAMFKHVKAALHAWGEVMDHLI